MIIITLFLGVHYLQFYGFFKAVGLSPNLGLSRWGITPKNASYLLVVGAAVTIFFHLYAVKLSPRRISRFRRLIEELLREKRYSEICSLFEKHLHSLHKIYSNKLLLPRFKRWLAPKTIFDMYLLQQNQSDSSQSGMLSKYLTKSTATLRSVIHPLSALLPSYERQQTLAKEVVRNVLLSKEFTLTVATSRPYFALRVFDYDFWEIKTFLDDYFRKMLSDTCSVLYFEIHNNQELLPDEEGCFYKTPESNPLLHYLFADARVAERLSVWKPVGRHMLSVLRDLQQNPVTDQYIRPMEDFHDRDKWDSSLYVGLCFFDIMVTSALLQGIEWHMWLYYLPLFTKSIVTNLPAHENLAEPDAEWPTKYNYLLYEIVSLLTNWIVPIKFLPIDQSNIVMHSRSIQHENANIPKSSMIALGRCLHSILLPQKISRSFKNRILEIVFRLYFNLREDKKLDDYAFVLISLVKQGGSNYVSREDDYISQLREALEEFDKFDYATSQIDELAELLRS
ncbi:MAG: hypothetical protein ABIH23_18730 [bacterium]